MAVVAGAKGRCPSGNSASTVVCSTGQEQFSQREPEIMICINGLSNKLAKIDALHGTQGMQLFLFPCLSQTSTGSVLRILNQRDSPCFIWPLMSFTVPRRSLLLSPNSVSPGSKVIQRSISKPQDAWGNLGVTLGSARCFGFRCDCLHPVIDLGPAVLPAPVPLAAPWAQRAHRRSPTVYAAGWNQLQVIPKNTFCPYFFISMIKNSFSLKT